MMRIIPFGGCDGHPADHPAAARCKDCDRREPGYDDGGHPKLEPAAYWSFDNPLHQRLICENWLQPLENVAREMEERLLMMREGLERRRAAAALANHGEDAQQ